jgi:hypothetical protein
VALLTTNWCGQRQDFFSSIHSLLFLCGCSSNANSSSNFYFILLDISRSTEQINLRSPWSFGNWHGHQKRLFEIELGSKRLYETWWESQIFFFNCRLEMEMMMMMMIRPRQRPRRCADLPRKFKNSNDCKWRGKERKSRQG